MDYKVKLEVFEGPLDLLLYLIKKDEVDIYDISIERITHQYLEYMDAFQVLNIELAGEFIVMAANLLYIKSRTLLPKDQQMAEEDAEEDDPRWELIRQLIEYKKFKEAAFQLRTREAFQEQLFPRFPATPELAPTESLMVEEVGVFDLIHAFQKILKRLEKNKPEDLREIFEENYTVSDKIDYLLRVISSGVPMRFEECFAEAASRTEVVVTFLAMLELIRLKQLRVRQERHFAVIWIVPANAAPASSDSPPHEPEPVSPEETPEVSAPVGLAEAEEIAAEEPPLAEAPAVEPAEAPAVEPAEAPAVEPAEAPAVEPAEAPAVEPAEAPAVEPAEAPAVEPAEAPTVEPAEAPTVEPTEAPAVEPAEAPIVEPAEAPAVEPAEAPTVEPAEAPTVEPAEAPTVEPAEAPTVKPAEAPAVEPAEAPAVEPAEGPTLEPAESPLVAPSESPTVEPAEGPLVEPIIPSAPEEPAAPVEEASPEPPAAQLEETAPAFEDALPDSSEEEIVEAEAEVIVTVEESTIVSAETVVATEEIIFVSEETPGAEFAPEPVESAAVEPDVLPEKEPVNEAPSPAAAEVPPPSSVVSTEPENPPAAQPAPAAHP